MSTHPYEAYQPGKDGPKLQGPASLLAESLLDFSDKYGVPATALLVHPKSLEDYAPLVHPGLRLVQDRGLQPGNIGLWREAPGWAGQPGPVQRELVLDSTS